jgi:hypothetical protein
MSKRKQITVAIAEKFKDLNGTLYPSNVNNNSFAKLKFWDECQNFPTIFVVPGSETREYLPADFTWGYLNVSVKIYCKGEFSEEELEQLLEDVEKVLDSQNGALTYNQLGHETTEISITSINTDEGLLKPYAVGEVNLLIRYQLMK